MSIEILSIRQVKAARALLAWSQHDLANASGVSYPTIARLEKDDGPLGGRASTVEAIRTALERAGVEFIAENGGGAGVRLSRPRRVVANSQAAPASEEKSRAGEE